MSPNISRYGYFFVLIHWLLALASLASLGLGWVLWSSPTTTPERAFVSELHVTLGFAMAILVLAAITVRILFRRPDYPSDFAAWRRLTARLTDTLIYFAILALLVSGYLRAAFTGLQLQFWGVPMPVWGEPDEAWAEVFAKAHVVAAAVLAGLILLHVGLVIAHSFRHKGFAGRMSPIGDRTPLAPAPVGAKAQIGSEIAQRLAGRLRFFGWAQFWLQFVLASLSAVLLQFATSGRALSAASAGFGDALYWAGAGLALLLVTCALGFHYARAAKKVLAAPHYYFGRGGRSGFWFLSIGLLLGLLGMAASFVGVALSISLLIAKTVSQPPGIAITDPSKIIRALDVFILLVNFGLLLAHSIGVGASLWLHIAASKSRIQYLLTPERSE